MKRLEFTLILLYALLAPKLSAGERLVYAVTHGSADNTGTEIFSIGPGDAQPTRVFSDVSSPVVLGFMPQAGTSAPFETAVIANRLFAPGKDRRLLTGPRATGIFEFSLDGSGRYRKILDLPAGERVDLLIANGDGTKLAYLSLGTSLTLFIHDVKTGNLLHKIDMLKIAGGGIVRNACWLPDNRTIFFTLEPGPGDDDNDYKLAGTWFMQEDGTALKRLSASLGVLHEPGYRSRSDSPPVMLGVVGGQYLFRDLMDNVSAVSLSWFLALAEPQSGKSTKITLHQQTGVSELVPSHSGRYIAYVQQDPSRYVGKNYVVSPERVWIQPLPTGQPSEMLSLDTRQERRTNLTLIGWMD